MTPFISSWLEEVEISPKDKALAQAFQISAFKWAESTHEIIGRLLKEFPERREILLALDSKIEEAVDRAIETYSHNKDDVMKQIENLNRQIIEIRHMLDE